MTDAVVVALISGSFGLVTTVTAIVFGARLNGKVNAIKYQVENNHLDENGNPINLREEADERHGENSSKLDTILEEIKSLRGSVKRLWARDTKHTDDIHELQLTHPRGASAPPVRHRMEQDQ